MSVLAPPLPVEERIRRERRRTFSALALGSVALHLLLAFLAAFWVVGRKGPVPPAAAVGEKPLPILAATTAPARPAGGAASATASAPVLPAVLLPALPLPVERGKGIEPVPAPPVVAVPAAAAPGTAAAPASTPAAGSGAGTGMSGDGFSLFGVGEGGGAKRIVIALDLSDSMFVRQPGAFERIAAETVRAVDGLADGTAFDLIVFEDGSLAWKPEPVPATAASRAEARAWLERIAERGRRFTVRSDKEGTVLFEGGGSRGDTMLRQAFGLRPDLLVVLTDGQWDVNPRDGAERPLGAAELGALAAALEKTLSDPARIDVFCLQTARSRPEELAAARSLAEGNGGRFTALPGGDVTR